MPQTSPMNWMILCSFLLMMMTAMSSKMNLKSKKLNLKESNKTMKKMWKW